MNIPVWLIVLLYVICVGWIVFIVAMGYINAKRKPMFPDIGEVDFVFEERGVSGVSDKSWFSRIGRAGRCLTIRVTTTELWISIPDIMAFVNKYGDFNHRVRLVDVVDMRRDEKQRVYVSFRVGGDEVRTMCLVLKGAEELMAAIEGGRG